MWLENRDRKANKDHKGKPVCRDHKAKPAQQDLQGFPDLQEIWDRRDHRVLRVLRVLPELSISQVPVRHQAYSSVFRQPLEMTRGWPVDALSPMRASLGRLLLLEKPVTLANKDHRASKGHKVSKDRRARPARQASLGPSVNKETQDHRVRPESKASPGPSVSKETLGLQDHKGQMDLRDLQDLQVRQGFRGHKDLSARWEIKAPPGQRDQRVKWDHKGQMDLQDLQGLRGFRDPQGLLPATRI